MRINQTLRAKRGEGNAINRHARDELFEKLAAVQDLSDQVVQAKSETVEAQHVMDERTHRVRPQEELVRPKNKTKYDSNRFRPRQGWPRPALNGL